MPEAVKAGLYEVFFSDADPDNDPDRAGDGYYFQVRGEKGSSGPWHSEEEAHREAEADIRDMPDRCRAAAARLNGVVMAAEDGLIRCRMEFDTLVHCAEVLKRTAKLADVGEATRQIRAESRLDVPLSGPASSWVRVRYDAMSGAIEKLRSADLDQGSPTPIADAVRSANLDVIAMAVPLEERRKAVVSAVSRRNRAARRIAVADDMVRELDEHLEQQAAPKP